MRMTCHMFETMTTVPSLHGALSALLVCAEVGLEDEDLSEEQLEGLLQRQADECSQEQAQEIVFHLGKQTVKQFMAAANLLQTLQQVMLYGMKVEDRITADIMVQQNFTVRKRCENARRARSLQDAGQGERIFMQALC